MLKGIEKIFFINKMSQESEYIPSQTPESEDYTSYESSSLETPSESSEYSIATSSQCSGSSDYNSSYFDETESEEEDYIEQFKEDGSRSSQPDVKI